VSQAWDLLAILWVPVSQGVAHLRRARAYRDLPAAQSPLRNGSLNQLAYSLFLFIRDLAAGDLVAWIDGRLAIADQAPVMHRLAAMGQALIGPLRNIHGLSDKVLNMALASLLLGAGHGKPRWVETGASLIAVDSLVHNCLARTGILDRGNAAHVYGPQCYGPGGCAAILRAISAAIDGRQFNAAGRHRASCIGDGPNGTYPICWLGYSQRTDLDRGGGERTLWRGGIPR